MQRRRELLRDWCRAYGCCWGLHGFKRTGANRDTHTTPGDSDSHSNEGDWLSHAHAEPASRVAHPRADRSAANLDADLRAHQPVANADTVAADGDDLAGPEGNRLRCDRQRLWLLPASRGWARDARRCRWGRVGRLGLAQAPREISRRGRRR
jgi:hypothetical protein